MNIKNSCVVERKFISAHIEIDFILTAKLIRLSAAFISFWRISNSMIEEVLNIFHIYISKFEAYVIGDDDVVNI